MFVYEHVCMCEEYRGGVYLAFNVHLNLYNADTWGLARSVLIVEVS